MVKFAEVIENLDKQSFEQIPRDLKDHIDPPEYFQIAENWLFKARNAKRDKDYELAYVNLSRYKNLVEKIETHKNIRKKEDYIRELNFNKEKVRKLEGEFKNLKRLISKKYDYSGVSLEEIKDSIRRDLEPPSPQTPEPLTPESPDPQFEPEEEEEQEEEEKNEEGIVSGIVSAIYSFWNKGGGLGDLSKAPSDN